MRSLVIAGLLAAFAAAVANAQTAPVPPAPITTFNCGQAQGTPLICVANQSHTSITGLFCVDWTTTAVPVPDGAIPSGQLALVNFSMGKCSRTILLQFADGSKFRLDNFDVKNNTKLVVMQDMVTRATK